MGQFANNLTEQPTRCFVLADNFRPRSPHPVERTESNFDVLTPATRHDGVDHGMIADEELQSSIRAALLAFK
jgi:hypothetical protein